MTRPTRKEQCSSCGHPRIFLDGSVIRGWRKAQRLSLREVARRMKWSASYVCDLELNRRNLTIEMGRRIEIVIFGHGAG